MHSKQDKINNNAWWVTDGGSKVLHSKSCGEIVRIYRFVDGDWWWECELFENWGMRLCGREREESYAMKKVYEYVMGDSKDKRNFYNRLVKDLQSLVIKEDTE